MIRLFALLIFSLLVTSCAITTGTDFTEGNGNVSLHLDGGVLYVNLKTPTLDPAKQGQISETRSYAVDESGKRYGLIIEPNEFARNYPEASYWTSDFIWLKGKDGKKKKWGHGKWTISL